MLAKIGKIIGIAVGAGIALLAALWLLLFVSLFYESRTTHWNSTPDENGFTYLCREGFRKRAAVTGFLYDPDAMTSEIVIPDSFGELPVVALGGYAGRGGGYPFIIELRHVHPIARAFPHEGSFAWYSDEDNYEIEYVDLTLHIGPNIQSIFAEKSGLDTGNKLYVPRVYVICDAENKAFYSENGRLYDKKGKLVEDFFYWDEDFGG